MSRGGLKLAGALQWAGLSVSGLLCLDVGQSTGGFTDCLLQAGAARVVGVDVGHHQLNPRLREDPRVICLEGLNARNMTAADLVAEDEGADGEVASQSESFDPPYPLITGDLSFISLTLVLPALVPLLAEGGQLLMLVKPQFELQPGQIGKGGIVNDPAYYDVVEQRLRQCCADLGLQVRGYSESVIQGGDGNREFFIHAEKIS